MTALLASGLVLVGGITAGLAPITVYRAVRTVLARRHAAAVRASEPAPGVVLLWCQTTDQLRYAWPWPDGSYSCACGTRTPAREVHRA